MTRIVCKITLFVINVDKKVLFVYLMIYILYIFNIFLNIALEQELSMQTYLGKVQVSFFSVT